MSSQTQRQHFVSRGYQKNFADDRQQLVVVDKHTGRRRLRGTKSTFVGADFNAYTDRAGESVNALEVEWARIEASILRRVREVDASNINTEAMRAAITSLLAIHMVRSREFERIHNEVYRSVAADLVEKTELDDEARAVFERDRGRQPEPGELSELARAISERHHDRREFLVVSMVRSYNRAVEKIAQSRLQLITIGAQTTGGFVITDTPVMHGDRATRRLGFRDSLAIGDADFLAAPIGRRTL